MCSACQIGRNRSCIFYDDENHRQIAKEAIEKASELYDKEIVTELEKIDVFWPAEEYHQYYLKRKGIL